MTVAFYWQTKLKGNFYSIEASELSRIDLELKYGHTARAEKMIQKALPEASKFTVAKIASSRLAIITSTIGEGKELTHGQHGTKE